MGSLIKQAALSQNEKDTARSLFDDNKDWQTSLQEFAAEDSQSPERMARYIKANFPDQLVVSVLFYYCTFRMV
jgi:hypothetical protein